MTNPPVTPADSPSNPSGYASVAVQSMNIQAPQADLSAVTAAAKSEALTRQPEAERVLQSPAGYGAFSIDSGTSGGGGEDWPSSVKPGA